MVRNLRGAPKIANHKKNQKTISTPLDIRWAGDITGCGKIVWGKQGKSNGRNWHRTTMACILFVDDDPDTLETMTRAVQIFGHQAVIASNGQEALVKAARTPPDLIFIDMRLPDISGHELISQLNNLEVIQNVPICMLTASVEQEAEDLAKAAGAWEYLTKPVRLQKLIEIIRQYTEP